MVIIEQMGKVILFTSDRAALHQVEAALLAYDSQGMMTLVHFEDGASGLDAMLNGLHKPAEISALLVDVTLPDGDGALLVDALRDGGHTAALVMMHDAHAFAMQRLGEAASRRPVAMISKTSPTPMLVAALRRALEGSMAAGAAASSNVNAPLTPKSISGKLTSAVQETEAGADIGWRVERLSAREREVLALFCQGYSGKDVARKLGTELKTVFNQCASIFEKTGVRPMRRLITLLAQTESRS
jgi:DNA-binding NarL/FixJ family response regulator